MRTKTFHRLAALAGTVALAATGLVATATSASAACSANDVKLIAVHGTNEDQYGRLLSTVKAIEAKTAYNATGTWINYTSDVSFNNTAYGADVRSGESALRSRLNSEYAACHYTKYVLLGYSMGADVVGDTLDTSGTQLSSAVKGQIKAVVLYGDPTFNGHNTFIHGTYDTSGLGGKLARGVNDLQPLAAKIGSWCDANDEWCQVFGTSESVHTGYFARYDGAAATFVKGKLGK